MYINTIEEFVRFIPTAGGYNPDPNLTEFDIIKPYLEESETWVITNLTGKDLFDMIAAGNDNEAKDAVSRIIACQAYYTAVPFIDLVQTPNGFAVVSNSNLTPASRERVERLLSWLKMRLSNVVDDFITLIFTNQVYNTEWKKFGLYSYYTECLYMTASAFCRYAKKNAQRFDLEEAHSVLLLHQDTIARNVSQEYFSELIDKRTQLALDYNDVAILKILMVALGLLYRNEKESAKAILDNVVNTMMDNLDSYPTFKTSKAYQLKTGDKYENKKDDPTFIFAG